MGKITRRGTLTLAAAVAATLAVAPGVSANEDSGTPSVPAGSSVERIAGAQRVDTAIQASRTLDQSTIGDTVIITRADEYADALASAPLADAIDAPVLITGGAALDSRVATELNRLAVEAGVSNVIVVGGTDVISEAVVEAIAELGADDDGENATFEDSITRISGIDRYETATLLAERVLEADADNATEAGAVSAARIALEDLLAADEAVETTAAERAEALEALEDALAARAAAEAALDEALAALTALQDQYVDVPAPDGFPSWEDAVDAATAIYQGARDDVNEVVDAISLLTGLVDEDDPEATFQDVIDDSGPELSADITAALTLLGIAPADVVAETNVALEAAPLLETREEAATLAFEALGQVLADRDEAAAAVEANEELLEQLPALAEAVTDARNAYIDAGVAITGGETTDGENIDPGAQEAYDDAHDAWVNALFALPTPNQIADAEADLAEARADLVAAAGNDIFLTTGAGFADALSAGAVAGEEGGVVLLTNGDRFDSRGFTEAYLESSDADVIAIGGPSANLVGDDDEAIVGSDRYATAALVAGEYFEGTEYAAVALGYDARYPNDEQAPDAVVASAFIANNDGPLLLTRTDQLPGTTASYISSDVTGTVFVFGGTNAISNDVTDAIEGIN